MASTSATALQFGMLDIDSTGSFGVLSHHRRNDSISSVSSSTSYDYAPLSDSFTRAPFFPITQSSETTIGISTRSASSRKTSPPTAFSDSESNSNHNDILLHDNSIETRSVLDAGYQTGMMSTAGPVRTHRASSSRSRTDSLPYPPHGEYGSSDALSEFFDAALVARQQSDIESESDWPVSRRSSMSSNGWSHHDPSFAESPLSLYDDPSQHALTTQAIDGYFPAPGHIDAFSDSVAGDIVLPEDQDKIMRTRAVLEKSAAQVKHAVTTSAQDRARGAFVQTWLGQSYELCPEGNVSRQGLYGSYVTACMHYSVKHINSASFGKAVRQKFPNIKTRRLGVRGASRYHYCGVRPANSAEESLLAQLSKEEASSSSSEETSGNEPDANSPESVDAEIDVTATQAPVGARRSLSGSAGSGFEMQPVTPTTARPLKASESTTGRPRRLAARNLSIAVPQTLNVHEGLDGQKTLGGKTARPLLDAPIVGYPHINEALQAIGPTMDHEETKHFWSSFTAHCNSILEAVRVYRFESLETIITSFWTSLSVKERDLVVHSEISKLIYRAEGAVYSDVLEYLHSRILHILPQHVFVSLKALAHRMEEIQTAALVHFAATSFPAPKLELAARFGHLITRHLSLCQIAQALQGIVAHPVNLHAMSVAWTQIDFESIKNQCALVGNCLPDTLDACIRGFKEVLDSPGPVPIDSVIRWANSTFENCIMRANLATSTLGPREVLMRFSFATSQIMRDLTLNSASSFGSFAIANTFLDEYLSFCVLRRVALSVSALSFADAPVPPPSRPADLQGVYSRDMSTATSTADFSGFRPNIQAIMTEQMDAINALGMNGHSATTSIELHTTMHLPTSLAAASLVPHQYSSLVAPFFHDAPMVSPMRFGVLDISAFDQVRTPASLSHMEDHMGVMDVEGPFGELCFESSPSATGSPNQSAMSPPTF